MKKNSKKQIKISVLVTLIFTLIISSMTIGFAGYKKLLTLSGNAIFGKIGTVEITDIDVVSAVNAQNTSNPTFEGTNATFNILFEKTDPDENLFQIIYEIEITNGYYKDYIFNGWDFDPTINAVNSDATAELLLELVGIQQGDAIPAFSTKRFQIVLTLDPSDPNASYSAQVESDAQTEKENEDIGTLLATVSPSTGNLQAPNTLASFTAEVINTYAYARTFKFLSSNTNFIVCDSTGTPIDSLQIAANTTNNYTFYLKTNPRAIFTDTTATTSILLNSSGIANSTAGNLTLSVDLYEAPDTDKVVVSGATISQDNNTVGKVDATWNRDDDGGTNVVDYVVLLYNNSGLVSTNHTNSSQTSYTFTNLSETTYHIIVYGIDEAGNTGADSVSNANQTAGYATRSNDLTTKWMYNVDSSRVTNNLSFSGQSQAQIGKQYTATLRSTNNNYGLPTSITIVMNNVTLTSGTDYTYSTSTGQIVINSVTGNIQITAEGRYTGGICLVAGTKIKLANNKYKNIEDITYSDLLAAWSYETGTLVYEYPIWIEKTSESKEYQKTTFSDGTILKTVGLHQVFSLDENRFVNIKDDFGLIKVGTTVAKEVNGKIKPIKVTKVETIKEDVKYYYVASSIYYNIISNNIITTSDQIVPGVTLSNMYGFDKNIKWPSKRKEIISKKGALYNYSDLDVMPYYLYYGSRGNETKLFVNLGYATTPQLIEYLQKTQLNPEKATPPIMDSNNNRLWMVTTSEDNVYDNNKSKYLRKEGSYYELPKSNNLRFKGWYNNVDNKIYQPNDKVKIIIGTHFTAIYN